MKSLLIEFHRFDNLNTGFLRTGDRYLIAVGSQPVQQFEMCIDHDPFLDKMELLRYGSDDSTEAAEQALLELGGIVTKILRAQELPANANGEFLQLDLVLNAAELAALPFEAALDVNGERLVVRKNNPVELTRRVRQNFVEGRVVWPAKPRILYAWARPMGAAAEVPYREHENALRTALDPWIPVGAPEGAVLTILQKASVAAIKQACEDAIRDGKPFSHVHILAHGTQLREGRKERFGLAFHSSKPGGPVDPVTPEALCEALAPLQGQPLILTLAACDGANQTNTIIPEKSIAHLLHVSGMPVVIASQLPLSIPGSTLLVQEFYGALLDGVDVRSALHRARVALYEDRENSGHDWASLVGFVRLPEGYSDQLVEVQLESVLTSLKAIQSWSDQLIASNSTDESQFNRLIGLLKGRLVRLESFLPETKTTSVKRRLEENLGLLGSAEKRLAELRFECGRRTGKPDTTSQEGLGKAREWYWKAFQNNLSNHWGGTQFLSLETVLSGRIADPVAWGACRMAAEFQKAEDFWALGSLAELYLLATAAGLPDRTNEAVAALEEMKARVPGPGFPLESTQRQFRRYVDWWTNANGFFKGRTDLSVPASRLVDVL